MSRKFLAKLTPGEQRLKGGIVLAMKKRPDLSLEALSHQILNQARREIDQEKSRYHMDAEAKVFKVGLKPVKGAAFGLHGLTSGVCIAADLPLWKDPNFKLLAITLEDETSLAAKQQVVGHVHVYEIERDGKKYITLPGINPSPEFLSQVNAKQFYEKNDGTSDGLCGRSGRCRRSLSTSR